VDQVEAGKKTHQHPTIECWPKLANNKFANEIKLYSGQQPTPTGGNDALTLWCLLVFVAVGWGHVCKHLSAGGRPPSLFYAILTPRSPQAQQSSVQT